MEEYIKEIGFCKYFVLNKIFKILKVLLIIIVEREMVGFKEEKRKSFFFNLFFVKIKFMCYKYERNNEVFMEI